MPKVIDSLVIEYLKRSGFEFTLSVFMPECGVARVEQIFTEHDVIRALHLDGDTSFHRALKESMGSSESGGALITRIFNGLSHVADVPTVEREMQTELEIEDLVEMRIRQADKDYTHRTQEQTKQNALALEDRIVRYQRELEARAQVEMEKQLARFKEIELAQMRVEERNKHQSDMEAVKSDAERRILEASERATAWEEQERKRLAVREKEMEKENLTLRQTLLDQSNRAVLAESQLRNEAELHAKSLEFEKDALQRRYDEVVAQLNEARGVKEKYSEKMQEAITQYKIDLNREHANLLSHVEVEKARIEAERAILQQKTESLEQAAAQVRSAQQEMQSVQNQLKEARAQYAQAVREKEDAVHAMKEMQLLVNTQKSSSALEFEIHSLKKQLVEAEKMAEKRQEDYQSLLKSLMAPKDASQKDLAKSRRMEIKWQRECQQLVMKLDIELNRNEDLRRKYEDQVLENKELKREIADLRVVLHQTQAALNHQMSAFPTSVEFGERGMKHRPYLPDPYDAPVNDISNQAQYGRIPDPRLSGSPYLSLKPYDDSYTPHQPYHQHTARAQSRPQSPFAYEREDKILQKEEDERNQQMRARIEMGRLGLHVVDEAEEGDAGGVTRRDYGEAGRGRDGLGLLPVPRLPDPKANVGDSNVPPRQTEDTAIKVAVAGLGVPFRGSLDTLGSDNRKESGPILPSPPPKDELMKISQPLQHQPITASIPDR
ncbi:oxidative DNA demethylase, partial [Borealophlyctis nickersoniae]